MSFPARRRASSGPVKPAQPGWHPGRGGAHRTEWAVANAPPLLVRPRPPQSLRQLPYPDATHEPRKTPPADLEWSWRRPGRLLESPASAQERPASSTYSGKREAPRAARVRQRRLQLGGLWAFARDVPGVLIDHLEGDLGPILRKSVQKRRVLGRSHLQHHRALAGRRLVSAVGRAR